MTYLDFLSDAEIVRDRGEWLVELYIKNSSGVEEILRYSRRGTATKASSITLSTGDVIPANTLYKKRVLTAPTITQSLWQQGAILSSSLPTFGNIELRNADRGLDQYKPTPNGYRWQGCRCKVFFGDYKDLANTLGKVFDGYLSQPQYSLSGPVVIPIRGNEAKMEALTSNRVYRGTSYCLELGTGARTISYGTPAAVNTRTNMTLERWVYIDTANTGAVVPWFGWNGASPWRVGLGATRAISLFGTISAATQSKTTTATLSTGKWYHIAIVVNGRDVTFYIYDDDTQVETVEAYTNVFTVTTRDTVGGGVQYEESTRTDATFRVWNDDYRVWNVARTATEIRANRFKPFTAGSIPSSLVHYVRYDDGTGTTVTDSSATAANGTISGAGASQFIWAMEGGPELAGKAKPDVFGYRFGVAPVLVDPIRYIYQVAGGGAVQSIATYEGGNPHTMDATAASLRAFSTTNPAAGHVLPYLAKGYFRISGSSVPTLPISATVQGYNASPLGYTSLTSTNIRRLITTRGPKLTDPGDLDTASFTAFASAGTDYTVGIALYEPKPIREVLDYFAKGSLGWWGYVRSSVKFHLQRFTGPAGSSDYSFDKTKIKDVEEIPNSVVIYEVEVRYAPNDTVLSEDQVAAAIKGTANWTQWTLPYQSQFATDETLRVNYPGDQSISLVIETGLADKEQARALADAMLALLKGPHESFKVFLKAIGLQTTIGQTEDLNLTLQNGQVCLGLNGTNKYVILSTVDDWQNGTIVNEVWR